MVSFQNLVITCILKKIYNYIHAKTFCFVRFKREIRASCHKLGQYFIRPLLQRTLQRLEKKCPRIPLFYSI